MKKAQIEQKKEMIRKMVEEEYKQAPTKERPNKKASCKCKSKKKK